MSAQPSTCPIFNGRCSSQVFTHVAHSSCKITSRNNQKLTRLSRTIVNFWFHNIQKTSRFKTKINQQNFHYNQKWKNPVRKLSAEKIADGKQSSKTLSSALRCYLSLKWNKECFTQNKKTQSRFPSTVLPLLPRMKNKSSFSYSIQSRLTASWLFDGRGR